MNGSSSAPKDITGRLAKHPWREGDPLPAVGSVCLVAGANSDVESDQHRAYTWRKVVGYAGEGEYKFVCLQKDQCWPTVERLENCWFGEIPAPQAVSSSKEQAQPSDLAMAVRLLHVVRAWSHTPGNERNSARVDPLYPQRNGRGELWKEIDRLLERYPYGSACRDGASQQEDKESAAQHDITRDQAIEIACRWAKALPQSYYAEPFRPHDWVVEAILEAGSRSAEEHEAHTTQLACETPGNRSVCLNGYQLKRALDFIAPDNDADQLESEVSIQWGDAGHSGTGYYACMTEYPEEGSILLDDKAPCSQCGDTGQITIYDEGGFGQLRSPIGNEPCPKCSSEEHELAPKSEGNPT